MSDLRGDRSADAPERDEPPLVLGLLARGADGFGRALKGGLLSLGRSTLLSLAGMGMIGVFLLFLVLGIADSPGIGGVLSGLAAGFIAALMFGAVAAWTLLWALSKSAPAPADLAGARELEDALVPTLRELRAVRADVIRQGKERSVLRVPLGIAGACLFWVLLQFQSDPPTIVELVFFVVVGALLGEGWAIGKLDREYRRLYKDRVLPQLASRFGDLTYRKASTDRVHALHAYRILRDFDSSVADDEIVGTHRGLPLSIVELRLTKGSGDDKRVVFDGLLIDLVLPRSLTGTTAVVADEGVVGNLKARFLSGSLQPVRIEDPDFDRHYEVYGTDQIEARALLTPAFMGRFTNLASQSRFSLPGGLAEGNRLVIALPKRAGVDLFEPPSYWRRAGGKTLVALNADIAAVLSMADAVIDLDFWSSGVARSFKPGPAR